MTIEDLREDARAQWEKPMSLSEIIPAMGTVFGDICRHARDKNEGKSVSDSNLQKELGNLLLSTLRWCDDLGFDPERCIEDAKQAHQKYRQE